MGEVNARLCGRSLPHVLRPAAGGASHAFELGWGDLLAMGGTCQRTWQHAVPKAARAGPRMSVQFRPIAVDEEA